MGNWIRLILTEDKERKTSDEAATGLCSPDEETASADQTPKRTEGGYLSATELAVKKKLSKAQELVKVGSISQAFPQLSEVMFSHFGDS